MVGWNTETLAREAGKEDPTPLFFRIAYIYYRLPLFRENGLRVTAYKTNTTTPKPKPKPIRTNQPLVSID